MNKICITLMLYLLLGFAYGCSEKQEKINDANIYLEKAKSEYKIKRTYSKEIMDNLIKSAQLGNDKAQLSLGVAFSEKKSSNYNYDQAIYWLKKQVEKNNYQAMYIMAIVIQEYDQKKEGDYLLIEKLLNSVKDKGELDAYLDLATLYYVAPEKFVNLKKTYRYSLEAANKKIPPAYFILGTFYEKGLNPVEKNINKAIYWYELGAKQKNVESLNKLALIYAYGLGVKKDNKKAIMYIDEAYDLDSSEAMLIIGKAYLDGSFGLTKNKEAAKSYFIDAVKNGNTEAENYLKLID